MPHLYQMGFLLPSAPVQQQVQQTHFLSAEDEALPCPPSVMMGSFPLGLSYEAFTINKGVCSALIKKHK